MKQFSLLILLVSSLRFSLFAQTTSPYQAYVELGGLVSSTERTPFWVRANQFGIIPYSAPNGTIRVGLAGTALLTDTSGIYARKAPSRAWLLNYGAEAIGNIGKETQTLAPEYYVQLAHRQIRLLVGRRREITGLADSTLSSGSYSWSGNTLPIPKILFGTKGFAPVGRRQWLAINAFMAHGLFANTDYMQHSFLHQKSLIFRVGKPTSPVLFYAGINHNVQWGGYSAYLDSRFAADGQLPGELRDFPNVLFAIRTNGLNNPRITSYDYVNLYGNHVGNIDFGLELKLAVVDLMLYHQHSFDDASGMFFKNAPDGLTGLRIRPIRKGSSGFRINSFLIEYLSTLNQSGPSFYQENTTTKGADNYFNNGQYKEGWTYQNRVIGTPFITRRQDVRPEYRNPNGWAIRNNLVQMAHIGLQATIAQRMGMIAKASYSQNYGLLGEPLSGNPSQLSAVVQIGTPVPWLGGMLLTASIATDFGELYTNATGGYVGIRKTVWHR